MNDQKQNPLIVVVRIMQVGDNLTTIGISVGGTFISPLGDTFIHNNEVAQFLHRLQPDEIQWEGRLLTADRDKIESDLAALRESRPDVQKINGELLEALEYYADEKNWCDDAHPGDFAVIEATDAENIPKTPTSSKVVSGKRARAAIRNAKIGGK